MSSCRAWESNEVFQIDRRRQDLRELLYSAVRCSVARGPRFVKGKMLRESGPYALLFIQLLIALVTDSASSKDICSTSFDT